MSLRQHRANADAKDVHEWDHMVSGGICGSHSCVCPAHSRCQFTEQNKSSLLHVRHGADANAQDKTFGSFYFRYVALWSWCQFKLGILQSADNRSEAFGRVVCSLLKRPYKGGLLKNNTKIHPYHTSCDQEAMSRCQSVSVFYVCQCQ